MKDPAAGAAEIATGILREVEAVVQNRPEHTIGETVVIFLIVSLDEVGPGALLMMRFCGNA
jgi:hypothetical protein